MRSVFENLVLFVLVVIVTGGFAGCSGTGSAERSANESAPQPSSNAARPVSEEAKSNPNYRPIEKAVDEAEIKNVDGTSFRVADRRGKVVLLNLWATWCGPCRAEMPTLVRMQDAHRDHLEVVGLNTDDESVEQINDFAKKQKLNYTLAWADIKLNTSLLKISKFTGIPQSFIIDREGNLRAVIQGANPVEVKKMEELVELIVNEG